jgi:hypothetical protein
MSNCHKVDDRARLCCESLCKIRASLIIQKWGDPDCGGRCSAAGGQDINKRPSNQSRTATRGPSFQYRRLGLMLRHQTQWQGNRKSAVAIHVGKGLDRSRRCAANGPANGFLKGAADQSHDPHGKADSETNPPFIGGQIVPGHRSRILLEPSLLIA